MTRAFPLSQALVLAAFFHAVVFWSLTPVLQTGARVPKIDLVFWGSILRAQDLMPGMREAEGISDVRVIAPVAHVLSAQVSAWRFGAAVEKPDRPQAVGSLSDEVSPEKFMTERVVLDDVAQEDDGLDLPQAETVSLKASRP
jgi:hypothetical protein